MTIRFTCTNPGCETWVVVADELGGQRIRCGRCGTVQVAPPAPGGEPGAGRAEAAGAGPGGSASAAALALDCLKAGKFGLVNLRAIFAAAVRGPLLYVALTLPVAAFAVVLSLRLWPLAVVPAGLFVTVAGSAVRFGLDVVLSGLEGDSQAPAPPQFSIRDTLADSAKALGIVAVYVLPVVTIPLLPLGLLALAYATDGRALDLSWAVRAARRRPRQLAVLWLMLAAWGGAMLLASAAVMLIFILMAWRTLSVFSGHWLGGLLGLVCLLEGAVFAVVLGLMFAAVCCRCIGLFGRRNPEVLHRLPRRAAAVRTAGFLAAGLVASAGLLGGIVLLAAALGR